MKNENDFVAAISTKLSLRTPGGGVRIDPLNTEIKNRAGSHGQIFFSAPKKIGIREMGFSRPR